MWVTLVKYKLKNTHTVVPVLDLFICMGFNMAFSDIQVISQWVVYGQRKPLHTVGQDSVL